VARLKEEGVKVTLEPETLTADGHDYRIAFAEDSDGYKVALDERGTMKVEDTIQKGCDEAPPDNAMWDQGRGGGDNGAEWKGVRNDGGCSGSEPTIALTHVRTAAIASEALPILV
jgi:hypothetical protein